jgi:hypothetical protein
MDNSNSINEPFINSSDDDDCNSNSSDTRAQLNDRELRYLLDLAYGHNSDPLVDNITGRTLLESPPWILTSRCDFPNIVMLFVMGIPAMLLVSVTNIIGYVIYYFSLSEITHTHPAFTILWDVLWISVLVSFLTSAVFLAISHGLFPKKWMDDDITKAQFYKWSFRLTFVLSSVADIFVGQIFHPYLEFNQDGSPTVECQQCLSSKLIGLGLVIIAAWIFCREKYERPVIEKIAATPELIKFTFFKTNHQPSTSSMDQHPRLALIG